MVFKTLFLSLIFFIMASSGYSMQWQELHEKADSFTLEQAQDFFKESHEALEGMYVLGLVYLNLHLDNEAGDIFSRMLKRDAAVVTARWGEAEVLRRQHHLDESANKLKDIIKSNPDFSPAYNSLASIYYFEEKFKKVIALSAKVIKQGKEKAGLADLVKAHCLYARAKVIMAHFGGPLAKIISGSAVMRHLEIARKIQPDSAYVYFVMGNYYLLSPVLFGRNLRKAEWYFQKTVRKDPLFADAYVRLGQVYKLKGDRKKYDSYIMKAFEIDSQNQLAIDVRSEACRLACFK